MTGAEEIAALRALLVSVIKWSGWLKTHPGLVKAAWSILGALSRLPKWMRPGWAAEAQTILGEAPGVLAEAEAHIPQAIFILQEIQPAPIGIPGGIGGARGHITG